MPVWARQGNGDVVRKRRAGQRHAYACVKRDFKDFSSLPDSSLGVHGRFERHTEVIVYRDASATLQTDVRRNVSHLAAQTL